MKLDQSFHSRLAIQPETWNEQLVLAWLADMLSPDVWMTTEVEEFPELDHDRAELARSRRPPMHNYAPGERALIIPTEAQ